MSVPVITELNAALRVDLTRPFSISHDIYSMFLKDDDALLQPADRDAAVWQRFYKAHELYQRIWNNGATRAPFAVFYRIDDRTALERTYNNARREIANEFKQWVQRLGRAPSSVEINQFFTDTRQALPAINRNLNQQIKFEVADYFLSLLNKRALETNVEGNMDTFFTAHEAHVKELASPRFYQVPDVDAAYDVGTIYGPGAVCHNWGVNAAWALGVARSGIPIKIISDLDMRNQDRSHPNPNQALNPSAFALEIAVAINMGYGLNIGNNVVTLTPPAVLNDHRTNGQPGDGPLPTKQEEIDIFRRCVGARELHNLLPRNAGADLRNHIHNICSTGTAGEKYDLAVGLNLLKKGNSLLPILNALSYRELYDLENMLGTQPFSGPYFQNLRDEIGMRCFAEYINTRYQVNNGQEVKNWMHGICTGQNNYNKNALINAFALMNNNGTATNVLNSLSLRELRSLDSVLFTQTYSNPYYDNLKNEVARFHFAAYLTASQQQNNGDEVRNWIHSICTGQNAFDKRALANALDLMRTRGTLDATLNTLSLREHDNLRMMLTNAPFATIGGLDTLRNTARASQLNALSADLSARRNANHGQPLRAWIDRVCNSRDFILKEDLVDTLELKRGNNTLRSIIRELSTQNLRDLRDMLGGFQFGTRNGLDPLRQLVDTEFRFKNRAQERDRGRDRDLDRDRDRGRDRDRQITRQFDYSVQERRRERSRSRDRVDQSSRDNPDQRRDRKF